MILETPLSSIKRIQPAYQKRLLKLGIKNLRDLLYHFPFRYDDFSKITPIDQLKLGEISTVQGQIAQIKNTRTWRKSLIITEAFLEDKTGLIKIIWFNQPYLGEQLKSGTLVSLSGKVNFDGTLFLQNPAYEKIISNKVSLLRHTGRLIPVYPETAGLSSRYLRYLTQIFLPQTQINDWLPQEIKKNKKLLDLVKALKEIHFPSSKKVLEEARHRLAFDELFLIQLFLTQQKIKWQQNLAPRISFNQELIKNFVSRLPFRLTQAQRRAAWEILQDLEKLKPMNRLLEGDVGSGKTIVAAMAVLQTAEAGWQTAFMAPTEILARQHFETLKRFFNRHTLKIAFLAGKSCEINGKSSKKCSKKEVLEKIKKGGVQIAVGTHALIQKKVQFKNLALAIVDEQHRFGVAQRAALQKNISEIKDGQLKTVPHLLSMTATPIPRTLALTLYSDLDLSLLDELPKNRKKIITKIVPPSLRQKAYEFIKRQVSAGRQIFVICPRIENVNQEIKQENQSWAEVKAVKEEFEKLSQKIFPDLKVAMLHGRMNPKEKQKIMTDFSKHQTDILVSTSVVEIGVDMPNASLILIEGAERFGLAQLHQFRGRVGRSRHQSFCLLFSDSTTALVRLNALIDCQNGFELAEKDLDWRGPGEFLGTRQSGLPDLSMASLTDISLIKEAKEEAQKTINQDPMLQNYPLLKEKLKNFQDGIHLE